MKYILTAYDSMGNRIRSFEGGTEHEVARAMFVHDPDYDKPGYPHALTLTETGDDQPDHTVNVALVETGGTLEIYRVPPEPTTPIPVPISWEQQYLDLLTRIILDGERRTYRNGDRVSIFRPPRIEVDLTREFPLVTTRKINWEFARDELLWFLGGTDNVLINAYPSVQRIWGPWAKERTGSIGDSYGSAWRGSGVRADQLAELIRGLRVNPNDSGHIVTLWHPDATLYQKRRGGIRPCHGTVIQCYIRDGRYLDLSTYQRSADVPVGLPYNLASYALLTHMLAQQTGYEPGRLIYELGDAHIYADQLGLVGDQLKRRPDPSPKLTLEYPGSFEGGQWPYQPEHITLTGYAPQAHIPYPVSV